MTTHSSRASLRRRWPASPVAQLCALVVCAAACAADKTDSLPAGVGPGSATAGAPPSNGMTGGSGGTPVPSGMNGNGGAPAVGSGGTPGVSNGGTLAAGGAGGANMLPPGGAAAGGMPAGGGTPGAGGVPVVVPQVTEAELLTGKWEEVTPNGTAKSRHECGFGEVNGKMYLVGGRETRDTEEYDPVTNTWKKVGEAPITLHHFQPVGYKGKLYIGGALTGGFPMEPPAPDFYVFDPANGQWTTDTRLPAGRERGAAGLAVYKDKFYVVSGITNGHWDGWVTWFDVYDPIAKTWAILPDAPRARDHVAVAVAGDKLYVAGGRNSSWKDGKNFSLTIAPVDVFDFATNKWSTLPNDLPTPRAGNSTVVVGNHLLIIGGETPHGNSDDALRRVEALNLATNQWIKLADMTSTRHATSVVWLDKKLYTAAGSVSLGGNPTNKMERWVMP